MPTPPSDRSPAERLSAQQSAGWFTMSPRRAAAVARMPACDSQRPTLPTTDAAGVAGEIWSRVSANRRRQLGDAFLDTTGILRSCRSIHPPRPYAPRPKPSGVSVAPSGFSPPAG